MLRVTARALARLRPPFPCFPIQTKPRATRRFQNPPAVSSTNPFFACTPPPSLPPSSPPVFIRAEPLSLPPFCFSIELGWVGGVRVGVVCTGVVARCFVLLVRKEERRGRGSKRGGRWRRSGSSRSSRTCRRILPPPAAQAQSRKICSTGKRRLWVHQIAHTLAASFWSQFTSLQTTHSNRPRLRSRQRSSIRISTAMGASVLIS